jgi:hypothetical protein
MMIISGSRPATEKRVIPARRARNAIEKAIEIGEKIEFGDLYSVKPPTSTNMKLRFSRMSWPGPTGKRETSKRPPPSTSG